MVPLFLNADVLVGPRGKTPSFHGREVHNFIELCKSVPNAVLSLGWTTSEPPSLNRCTSEAAGSDASKHQQQSHISGSTGGVPKSRSWTEREFGLNKV
jgi:hypothetical protein